MAPAHAVIECAHPTFDPPETPPPRRRGPVDSASVRSSFPAAGSWFRIPFRVESTCAYALCSTPVASYLRYRDEGQPGYCSAAHARAERNRRVKERKATAAANAAARAVRRAEHERNTALKAAQRDRCAQQVAAILAAPTRAEREAAIRAAVLEEDAAHPGGAPRGFLQHLLSEVGKAQSTVVAAHAAERQCVDPGWRAVNCPWPDKEAWLTRDGAWAVIKVMRQQNRPRAENLHAYHCSEPTRGRPGCGSWHVGDWTVYEEHVAVS